MNKRIRNAVLLIDDHQTKIGDFFTEESKKALKARIAQIPKPLYSDKHGHWDVMNTPEGPRLYYVPPNKDKLRGFYP